MQILLDFQHITITQWYYTVSRNGMKCGGVKKKTSSTVINFSHELFARIGIPEMMVSDKATHFVSGKFINSRETYTVEHVTAAI